MRRLSVAVVVLLLSLVVAGAAGLDVPGGSAASGSGDIVSPPLAEIEIQLFPDTETPDYSRLDFVQVCMDRGSSGSDPEDTTAGTTDHYDLYVQLKDGSGNALGVPRVVHNFANGIDGARKCDDVSFFEDDVDIGDIGSIDFTICGRHESGDGDFQCRTPP